MRIVSLLFAFIAALSASMALSTKTGQFDITIFAICFLVIMVVILLAVIVAILRK